MKTLIYALFWLHSLCSTLATPPVEPQIQGAAHIWDSVELMRYYHTTGHWSFSEQFLLDLEEVLAKRAAERTEWYEGFPSLTIQVPEAEINNRGIQYYLRPWKSGFETGLRSDGVMMWRRKQ